MNERRPSTPSPRVVDLVPFVLAAAVQLVYTACFYRLHFNSDDAVINLLAESIRRHGSLLPPGWISYNGDLTVPSGALIIAALLPWFPNGYGLHVVVGIFAVCTLLGAWIAFLRALGIPWRVALAFGAVLAYGFSHTMAEMIYQQASYFWWSAGFLAGGALIARARRVTGAGFRRRNAAIAMLFVLVFSLSFSNPARMLVMMVFPLYAFDFALRWRPAGRGASGPFVRDALERLGLRDPLAAAGLAAAFLCAAVLYYAALRSGRVETRYGAAGIRWGGAAHAWPHLMLLVRGWFYYLGADRYPVSAADAAAHPVLCLRIALAYLVTAVGAYEVAWVRGRGEPARRAVLAAFLAAFVPVFVLYVFFEPLAYDLGSVRYFIVPMLALLALASFSVRDAAARFAGFGPCLPALSFGVALLAVCSYIPAARGEPSGPGTSRQERLAALLQRERLEWGYATWWNAGATTVLSDSKVHVVPVVLDARGVQPTIVMVQREWYEPAAWTGQTFFALANEEATPSTLAILRTRFGEPRRVVRSPDYAVLVYDANLSARFGCMYGTPMTGPIADFRHSARVSSVRWEPAGAAGIDLLRVGIRNEGDWPVSGVGRGALSVGVQLLGEDGAVIGRDWAHFPLDCPIRPGAEREMLLALPAREPHARGVKVDLVQEGVAWFGAKGVPTLELAFPPRAAPVR